MTELCMLGPASQGKTRSGWSPHKLLFERNVRRDFVVRVTGQEQ